MAFWLQTRKQKMPLMWKVSKMLWATNIDLNPIFFSLGTLQDFLPAIYILFLLLWCKKMADFLAKHLFLYI